ncbi:type II RES/Xre toxin-antitoxin system antitoxin [Myroides injenensis]|uniref:type II RES/Xre toxin-antitoxin system antitoxin n=1 Tax=Myroides injenensis TaxID=1183151 RepID=UPI000289514B|nr:antitoxin Xre/MbcA/ParS toxin-binding domain-containing protein [Myroides injenensis]
MKTIVNKTKPFNTKKSVQRASQKELLRREWMIESEGKQYIWTSKMERVAIIREGIPYSSLEIISKKLNRPIKTVLSLVGMPQTTYNKKKNEKSLLDRRDSELVLLIIELVDFGLEVFNLEEDKFQRWLKKPNLSLGGNTPESMLDTLTGINEVKFALNRLEYGNLA